MRRVFCLLLCLVCAVSQAFAEVPDKKTEKKRGFFEDLISLPIGTVEELEHILSGSLFNLGEIRVTDARLPRRFGSDTATRLPRNITFIGKTALEESSGALLPDTLNLREGVTYTDDIGMGLNARVDLRSFGGEGKQALVLFDGARAVEPFDNSMTWHLVPTEYLEQVEIQRGGGSTVFGEGALSGVILLRSKEPQDELRIASESSYGDFTTRRTFVEAHVPIGGFKSYTAARYMETAGYRQNADHESESGLNKIRGSFGDLLTFENSFYIADNDTGIPGPLTREEIDQNRRQKDPEGQFGDAFKDRVIQNTLTTSFVLPGFNLELANLASVRRRDQNSLQSFGGFFGGASANEIKTLTYSNVIQTSQITERGPYRSDLTLGFEASKDDIHNPFEFRSINFGPFSSDRSIDRRMIGIFVQHELAWNDRIRIESGARGDKINWNIYDLLAPDLEKHKKTGHWSPKIGIEADIFETLAAYANYSEAFKAPDSNTLIFETPNIFTPNPDIDPQIARHREAGLRFAHPAYGSVRGGFFYIETKKEILFNDITNLNENFDTIREGIELAAEIALAPGVQVFGNYTYARARFDNGAFDKNTLPLVPESKGSAGFLLEPAKGLKISGDCTGVYNQFALNDFNNIFPIRDYFVAGGKISYGRGPWELYLRAENLLDRAYDSFVTSNGIDTINFNPAPERYFEGGFKIQV